VLSRIRFGWTKTLSVTPHSGHWNATRPGLPANESIVATVCIARLHCRQIAWFVQCMVAPRVGRCWTRNERISKLISGKIKTDVKNKSLERQTWERTKHDVLNPTQSDSRLFWLYSSLRNRSHNTLQVEQVGRASRSMGCFQRRPTKRRCILSPEKVCMCGGVEGLL
jgi:hypothetical protein